MGLVGVLVRIGVPHGSLLAGWAVLVGGIRVVFGEGRQDRVNLDPIR
jgi:hypothetical protein